MKKTNFISILILISSCTSRPKGELFPNFSMLLADSSTRFSTASIKEGHPIVLMYFSPDCEHCQKETEVILKNMHALENAQFYFVTNDPLDRLKAFIGYYKVSKYSNITLGRDDQFFLLKYFKGAPPPYLVLYDRHKRQRAAFQGEMPIDTIISFITKSQIYE